MTDGKQPNSKHTIGSKRIVEVTLDAQEMEAYVTIYDFSPSLHQLVELVKSELKAHHVRFGFIRENLRQLFKEKPTGIPILIARGTPPEKVEQVQVTALRKFLPHRPVVIDTVKEIHPDLYFPNNLVLKNTPLLELKFSRPARPGKTVTGKIIEPYVEEAMGLKLGPNVAFDKSFRYIVAACDGNVIYQPRHWIDVVPIKIIKGDQVEPEETIESEHSVLVSGPLKRGARIISSKNIFVNGVVENCYLEAGENIVISRGAVGEEEGFLKAGQNIILSFARFQALEAGCNIAFRLELLHCQSFAGQKIISVNGRIVGGKAEALEKIIVNSAGNRELTPTQLQVGRKELLFQKKQYLNKLVKQHQEQLKKIKQKIYDLVIRKIDNLITESQLEELETFQKNKAIIPEKIQELEAELTRLNKEIEKIELATIEILDMVYPEVIITVGEYSKTIESPIQHVTYTIQSGTLRELRL